MPDVDEATFERLVADHRVALRAHCYRMLGSVQDAEDALQETLLGAWRGLPGFEGRSSLRTWLYRIATHACLRLADRRPRRVLSPDHGPARTDVHDLGDPVEGPVWLEPYPDRATGSDADPAAHAERREHVELAFVAALQHLAPAQRAVLVLREALQFSSAEVAEMMGTTVAAVNSSLQRARQTVEVQEMDAQSAELLALGAGGRRRLAAAFVEAWERLDVDALLTLLTDDARFTMPPLPAWFEGRPAIRRFVVERASAFSWRLRPTSANGQLAFACYASEDGGPHRLGAVNVLSLRDGAIAEITAFLDPAVHATFGLAATP